MKLQMTRKAVKALGFGLVALAATLSAAQAQQPAPAQAPAQPPTSTAPPVQITPAHLAIAKAVVVESGISRSFDVVVPQMIQGLKTTLSRTRPEVMADLDQISTALLPEFDSRRDDMVEKAANIFALRFSEDELKQMSAFFTSDVGKKYVQLQPALLDEMFQQMQGWAQGLEQFVIQRVREELNKKGHKF